MAFYPPFFVNLLRQCAYLHFSSLYFIITLRRLLQTMSHILKSRITSNSLVISYSATPITYPMFVRSDALPFYY